jgi:two-component system, sensor histidine kinase RegB
MRHVAARRVAAGSVQSPAMYRDGQGEEPRETPDRINLSWLVRLRWGAVVGQLLTIVAVDRIMGIPLPLTPLLGVVGLEAASNAAAALWLRERRPVRGWMLPAAMATDVVILTGLLFFTGGPFNPFSFLYLVHIALGAVVLRPVWTWSLVALSLVCSGALFYGHVWLSLDYSNPASHAQHMRMHLEGMWIAFAVASGFIVYFVTRVRRALARREADLAAERALAARNERLASLATLAAGAAHELATPLGTIAVVAREIERIAERQGPGPALEDIRLIRAQVDRCRGILSQLAADAGASAGESFSRARLSDLVALALDGLPAQPPVAADFSPASDREVLAPRRALSQALRAVMKNAQDASGGGAGVQVTARTERDRIVLQVIDRGAGMSPDVLARAGEPFFTTKAPGRGMGLGLFLARSLVESLGGGFEIHSAAGEGTRVSLSLPLAAPLPERAVPQPAEALA